MPGFEIKQYKFDTHNRTVVGLESHHRSKDWPVVYLIHNSQQLYIGETSSAVNRMNQHLQNPERGSLEQVKIIFDEEYNKSAILDIEQMLIQLYSVDGKFSLQNRNGGQSKKHNYYQREKYLNKIDEIWERLHAMQMNSKSIIEIRNDDLFKYSPYNSLTEEQSSLCVSTLNDILNCLNNGKQLITIIKGAAGTGKSVVMMNMIFQLVNATSFDFSFSEEDEDLTDYMEIQHKVKKYLDATGKQELKVAYVIAMTSFRETIKQVFTLTRNGLKASMVIGPTDIKAQDVEDKYDVLFVDEAHRLAQRKNISYMGAFDSKCRELFGDDCDPKEYSQLDWLIEGSKNIVLVYDEDQRVAGSDITKEQFLASISRINYTERSLTSQMRCLGGKDFADYVKEILECSCTKRIFMNNYEFKLFNHITDLVSEIKEKEQEYRLCRIAAGYSWEWRSKGIKTPQEVIQNHKEDIEIEGNKYIWNMNATRWILGENAINEIGCIHTTQGYDLNYVGVIFGREIDYNPETNEIEIDSSLFYDKKAKNGCSTPELLKNYIVNAYRTMMFRGIHGCYVYVCNENLRKYLSQYMQVEAEQQTLVNAAPTKVPAWKEKLEQSQRKLGINIEADTDVNNCTIVSIDDIKDKSLRFKKYVPLFDLKAACGGFESGETVLSMAGRSEEKGWIDSDSISSRINDSMFVIEAKGESMLDKIHPGDLCLFERYSNKNAGSRNGQIVLAKRIGQDSDYQCEYTIKEYHSEKEYLSDGTWRHTKIELRPLNKKFSVIELSEEEDFEIIGILKEVLH